MGKIKLSQGFIEHGQFHRRDIDARSFKPKSYPTPALAGGMRDVSASGHPLAFVGGTRPLDDEPNSKLHMGKQVPVSPSMEAPAPNGARVRDGFDVLRAAGDYHDNRKFGVNVGVLPTKNVGR